MTLQRTATHCNTLQHTATHCNALQHTTIALPYTCNNASRKPHTATHCSTMQHCNTLQHTATRCNTLQHSATHYNCSILHLQQRKSQNSHCNTLQHTATLQHITTVSPSTCDARHKPHIETRYNLLQHAATRCNTLQHAATHCNTLQHTATHCITLQHTATHCSTLQHTATHCNTLQPPHPPLATTHCASCAVSVRHYDNATPCNTLQHSATHRSTPQYTTTNCNLQVASCAVSVKHCNTLPHTATHCNKLPNTATHCNTQVMCSSCAVSVYALTPINKTGHEHVAAFRLGAFGERWPVWGGGCRGSPHRVMWYQSGMSILLPSAWGLSGKDGLSRGGLLGISTTRTTLSAVHEHVPVTLVGAYRQRWSLLGGGGAAGDFCAE